VEQFIRFIKKITCFIPRFFDLASKLGIQEHSLRKIYEGKQISRTLATKVVTVSGGVGYNRAFQ
jgi:hypothetical protein